MFAFWKIAREILKEFELLIPEKNPRKNDPRKIFELILSESFD